MPTIKLLKHQKPPRRSDTANRQARMKIYQSVRWKKLREAKLVESPLCEICLQRDMVIPAEDVHHIISFMTTEDSVERHRLAYDYDNLQSLCKQCHQKIHNNGKKEKL